jgi:hypothetical protein
MSEYSEERKCFVVVVTFPLEKRKELPKRASKEEAYRLGMEALNKYPNATGFLLFEKQITKVLLTEIKQKTEK